VIYFRYELTEGYPLEDKFDLILTAIKELSSEVSAIKSDVHSLKEGQERIEKRLDSIDSKIAGIPDSYENLENFVGKQQRIIDELSARSVEHGVEIKTLNRMVRNQ
jgi:chromosome segregation ATPase